MKPDDMNYEAKHFLTLQHELGEGPLWQPEQGRLFWVNIEAGEVHSCTAAGKDHQVHILPSAVGALAFRKGGGFLLATRDGFAFWNGAQELTFLPQPQGGFSGRRFNDGRVDPAGRFFAGTLSDRPECELYRLDADLSVHTVQQGITISNGLGWSPDNKIFYLTDTPQRLIYRYTYDSLTGTISDREAFISVPDDPAEGVPDGLCVDAEGCVWSARWGGWKVVRYNPEGKVLTEVHLPTALVTSCAFGGPELDTLYITTAAVDLSADERRQQPEAGDMFYLKPGVRGFPEDFFAG